MPGCASYSVRPSEHFADSYVAVTASHYSTDPYHRDQFQELMARYLAHLAREPRPDSSLPEPWPHQQSSHRNGLELRKIRFQMPGLKKSAQKGRIIYIIDERACTVIPVWVYTHEEFERRPGESDLRDCLRRAVDTLSTFLEENEVSFKFRDGRKYSFKGKITVEESGE